MSTTEFKPKKTYVNGFMFDEFGSLMALIRKRHFPPNQDWSKHPYNGIGGKIEPNEKPVDAMVREFFEETGVLTHPNDWTMFAVMENPQWIVYYFKAFDTYALSQVRTMTDEEVEIRHAEPEHDMVHHLSFLIPLALYKPLDGAAMIREVSDEPSANQAAS